MEPRNGFGWKGSQRSTIWRISPEEPKAKPTPSKPSLRQTLASATKSSGAWGAEKGNLMVRAWTSFNCNKFTYFSCSLGTYVFLYKKRNKKYQRTIRRRKGKGIDFPPGKS
uniref:Uncharacterized protein n=1 Tax=Meleagris gallopavo TaxID=9103 RepID=A0A803XU07_MELGA